MFYCIENRFFEPEQIRWERLDDSAERPSPSFFFHKYQLYPFISDSPPGMDAVGHQRNHTGLPASASGRHPLQTSNPTCCIPAKTSGIVSLSVQFVILVASALTTIFFFYHVGGYEYMGWNENRTILEPIISPNDSRRLMAATTMMTGFATLEPTQTTIDDSGVAALLDGVVDEIETNSTTPLPNFGPPIDDFATAKPRTKRAEKVEVETVEAENATLTALLDYDDNSTLSFDDQDEQMPNTSLYIGWVVDAEIDFLELIRISTLVYLAMCAVWFLSLLCLVVAIKTEIPDLVVANMTVTLIAILYLIVHACFVGILIYLQIALNRHLTTKTLIVVFGTIAVLFLMAIAGFFCVVQDVAFYNHICYINDSSGCLCLSAIANLIKGTRRRRPAHEYALPENTQSPPQHIPYADDPQAQEFSHF
ncbi:unnamed protein product, partial [Mesorhabditis spiculigera]